VGQKASGGGWASQEKCERLLGLTDWNRLSVLTEMLRRFGEPPLSGQPNNPARRRELEAMVAALRARMTDPAPAQARAVYLEALQRAPDDFILHENFAEFLEDTGKLEEALAERQIVRDLTPHYYVSHYNFGRLLRNQRRYAEAEAALREAARLNAFQLDVRLQLGSVYGLQQKWDSALAEFEIARELAPMDPRPPLFAGEALWKLNRSAESTAMLRESLRLNPEHWEVRYRLGEQLAQAGNIREAATEFEEVLRLNPRIIKARVNLGVAFARLGRPADALRQCDEALALDPQNKPALQLREQLLADQRKR
jgi:tetratricopeptide (TPR) repeat protein